MTDVLSDEMGVSDAPKVEGELNELDHVNYRYQLKQARTNKHINCIIRR